ncbi:MAG TPA: hypothetical protein VG245_06875 [Candidatus Dormibacteraeota bacterium]|jgi:hypothetical protein|nr:hypothetical protein [Candidatus Dormibacteraeota bacterium]
MGSIVIRRGRGRQGTPTSHLYQDAADAERAAAAWRAQGQEVQVINTAGRRPSGWVATVRRWLTPRAEPDGQSGGGPG